MFFVVHAFDVLSSVGEGADVAFFLVVFCADLGHEFRRTCRKFHSDGFLCSAGPTDHSFMALLPCFAWDSTVLSSTDARERVGRDRE